MINKEELSDNFLDDLEIFYEKYITFMSEIGISSVLIGYGVEQLMHTANNELEAMKIIHESISNGLQIYDSCAS